MFVSVLYNAHQATKTAGLRKLEVKDIPDAFRLLNDVRSFIISLFILIK